MQKLCLVAAVLVNVLVWKEERRCFFRKPMFFRLPGESRSRPGEKHESDEHKYFGGKHDPRKTVEKCFQQRKHVFSCCGWKNLVMLLLVLMVVVVCNYNKYNIHIIYIYRLPIIMEVEHACIWKVTTLGGTHFSLSWLWDKGYDIHTYKINTHIYVYIYIHVVWP